MSLVPQAVAGGLMSHLIVEGCKPDQGSSEHIYKVSPLFFFFFFVIKLGQYVTSFGLTIVVSV